MSPRLAGSWEHVGRKPRVFRCLASKTIVGTGDIAAFCMRVPATRGGRAVGGQRLLPVFWVLLFAHHQVAHFLTWEHLFAERPFCLRYDSAIAKKNGGGGGLLFTKAIALRAPARPG
jgi:hypothetical protein